MTQEEKSILLQDLCARLPFKVKVKVWDKVVDWETVIAEKK